MTLSPSFISRLRDDSDRIEALTFLAECAERYTPGMFTPAWEKPKNDDRIKRYVALAIHATRRGLGEGSAVDTLEVYGEGLDAREFPSSGDDAAQWLMRVLFCATYAGYLVVTNGGRSGILDIILAECGPHLVERGYQIEPCLGQHGIAWLKLRKGKRTWTITTLETMTGSDLPTLLESARIVTSESQDVTTPARSLYSATVAYATFLLSSFGTALRPTVGMIASACARRFLPQSVVKWRPNPLLVAVERAGLGYRGGIAFGTKFRGALHRIDVNRQYTATLAYELPLESTFTKHRGEADDRAGVFVCTITASESMAYPVGVWQPAERRFAYSRVASGRSVCVLHTSEWPGLRAHGVHIEAGYGFAFTQTFSLSAYVSRIESICERYGRNSAVGKLTKPLGNMVYGKFGQKPSRWQLCYAAEAPDNSWYPYCADNGEDIAGVWERESHHVGSGMHVEIAAHITGYARSQTLETWAYLEACGLTVVRAHTDSITTYGDPRPYLELSDEIFGAWKYEGAWHDGIVIGPNAYANDESGHIAGVSSTDRRLLEELHSVGTAFVSELQNTPRQGWQRGEVVVTRVLTG